MPHPLTIGRRLPVYKHCNSQISALFHFNISGKEGNQARVELCALRCDSQVRHSMILIL